MFPNIGRICLQSGQYRINQRGMQKRSPRPVACAATQNNILNIGFNKR